MIASTRCGKSIGKLVVFRSEAGAAMRSFLEDNSASGAGTVGYSALIRACVMSLLSIAAYLGVVLLRAPKLSHEKIIAGTSKLC